MRGGGETGHPFMHKLTSDDGRDPLAEPTLREEAAQPADPHHSPEEPGFTPCPLPPFVN